MHSENYPFFIFSCGRSGSSLLSRMLNAHPRIAVPYESHLFNTFYPWLRYYGDLTITRNLERLITDILSTDVMRDFSPQVDKGQVLSLIPKPDFGGVVDSILRSWASGQNKSRWGEKTPKHLFYWREIRECFPKAKILHIVRDGRDVSLSWIRARFGPKTVYAAAKTWTSYLNRVEEVKASIPEDFYEVHYEDLLENPKDVLHDTCDFLGESFFPEMLEFYKDKTAYKTDTVNLENLSKPLLKQNKGKWKTEMTRRDLRIFESVAKSHLCKYGYELSLDNSALTKTEILYHRFIEHPPRKLMAMVRNSKGHRDSYIRSKILLRLVILDRFV